MISISIAAILVLTYLGAYISAAETALFSLSRQKLKSFEKDPDTKKQKVYHLLLKSRDLLVTIFMLNTLFNILLQNVISAFVGAHASLWLKVGIPLILTLVVGEIIPKYYGLQNNISLSLKVAPAIQVMQEALGPIRRFVVFITTPISRALFFFLKKDETLSREEIDHVVKASEKQGTLTPDESQFISGYLDLQESEVRELMWPREDIISFDITQPLSKLTHIFTDEECSRLPVTRGSIDSTIGVMDAYTYFTYQHEIKKSNDLIPFCKKPFYVPETTIARNLLKKMQKEENEFALCVDEYGSITGLITREDLLEVVVGQIIDSRDQELSYSIASENEMIASGKMELGEFNDLFDARLESENGLVTLGGWITEQAGDIPKPGFKMEKEGFYFQVLGSSQTKVDRIYVRRLPK